MHQKKEWHVVRSGGRLGRSSLDCLYTANEFACSVDLVSAFYTKTPRNGPQKPASSEQSDDRKKKKAVKGQAEHTTYACFEVVEVNLEMDEPNRLVNRGKSILGVSPMKMWYTQAPNATKKTHVVGRM